MDAAKEALTDMPPRLEQELDPVTLHNQALMHMEDDPSGGFEKLNFLLQQPPTPPETFGNLLLLYLKYDYLDLAADLSAENGAAASLHLNTVRFINLFEFFHFTLLNSINTTLLSVSIRVSGGYIVATICTRGGIQKIR